MNIWQIAQQIKYRTQEAVWPGSSTKVFHPDSVIVLEQGTELEALDTGAIPPLCIIAVGGGSADPIGGEEPELKQREITLTLVAMNSADRTGQSALLGANREGQTDSRGRGVLELEEPVMDQVALLNIKDGVVIQYAGLGDGIVRRDEQNNIVSIQDHNFTAIATSDRFYAPAARFAGTGKTGEVSLSWRNPATRFDSYRARLVRKAGATPPTSPTDGTIINLAASPSTPSTYADSGLAAGTYSYALYITYSEFDRVTLTDERFSDAVTVAGVVVA